MQFYIIYFILYFFQSIYQLLHNFILHVTAKGLTTPCSRWVARICYLCAGAANEVLRGSPTGLITLVLNLGKYLFLLYCIILSSSGKSQRSSQVSKGNEKNNIDGAFNQNSGKGTDTSPTYL